MIPTIVVAGFGRCGSSLVMQMLSRGGMSCLGQWPAFEDERTMTQVSATDIEAWRGKAVKVLDPQRVGLPGDVRVIWIDRDRGEQTKSHAKFMRLLLGVQMSREQRRGFEASLVRDLPRAMVTIGSRPLLRLRFESILAEPAKAADLIAAFVAPAGTVDAERMAQAVVPREPQCLDGLLEAALLVSQRDDDGGTG